MSRVIVDPDWEVTRRIEAIRGVALWADKPLRTDAFALWERLIKLRTRWVWARLDGRREPIVIDSLEQAL